MPEYRVHDGELVPPVRSLEGYFRSGGTTVLRAAFEHSFFVHPDSVRGNTPMYPDRVLTTVWKRAYSLIFAREAQCSADGWAPRPSGR